jgi:hypothetical protein
VAHPRVVVRSAQVRLDERRGDAGGALGEDRCGRSVDADLGVAILREQCREGCEIAPRLGDPHRDLGGALEGGAQLLVPIALGQLFASSQRRQRLLVRVRVGLSERCNTRPERLGLADHTAGFVPVALRGSRHLRHEPGGHRDDDRGGRAATRGRIVAGKRVEQLAEGCVKQVAGHAGTILCVLWSQALANGVEQVRIGIETGALERGLGIREERLAKGAIAPSALDDLVQTSPRERNLLRSLDPRLGGGGKSAEQHSQGFLVVVTHT